MDQPGGQSEECLVLNFWTPALKSGKRPVMVFFHGGGFTGGSSSAPGYNGEPLARFGDVVVVTINHRLGCLGYLHLADLDAPRNSLKPERLACSIASRPSSGSATTSRTSAAIPEMS